MNEGKLVRTITLEAENSPRHAWYKLELRQIQGGYVIAKASGARGAKPAEESYYRPTLDAAQAKFDQILRGKIKSRQPRHYNRVGYEGAIKKVKNKEEQLGLFR